LQIPSPHNVMAKILLAHKLYVCVVRDTCLSYLTLWPWSWTFKFQNTICVKCDILWTYKKGNIVKYTTFCTGISGDVTSNSKKKIIQYIFY